jgi:hypothetical protein
VSAPSILAELAAGIRRVNAAFNRLPPKVQESIAIAYDDLEAKVDQAILADDREAALAAIGDWQRHWLEAFQDNGGPRPDPRTRV